MVTWNDFGKQDTARQRGEIPQRIDFPRSAIETSISDRFAEVVMLVPHQLALVTTTNSLTYAELNAAANCLAHKILEKTGADKRPIVLLADFEATTTIAIMGILKAGCPYVALQPQMPPARLTESIDSVDPPLILHTAETVELAKRLCAANGQARPVDIKAASTGVATSDPACTVAPDDLAAIFFTSGSTGRPKGVMRSHANVMHRVWHESLDYDLETSDRFSGFLSCMFGSSAADMFGALLNGATFYPMDLRSLSLDRLADWIDENQISICHPPVTFTRQILKELTATRCFNAIRAYMLSGQSFFTADIDQLRRHLTPECIIVHRLASTETSVLARLLLEDDFTAPDAVLPVGYAVPDKTISILDEAGAVLPPNHVGQIAVRSRFLSPGYWKDPAQTAAHFLSQADDTNERLYLTGDLGRIDADGLLRHAGRADLQVKIRGYRVDLTFIEAKLSTTAGVQELVVVAVENKNTETQLVAYLSGSTEDDALVQRVRAQALSELPNYMIPQQFILLNKIPTTPNGKIDRKRLPHPGIRQRRSESKLVPPRTATERDLTAIWQCVLQIDEIGIYDSFFDLGGTSLEALQIANKVRRTHKIEITPSAVMKAATVAEMSLLIIEAYFMILEPEEVEALLHGISG